MGAMEEYGSELHAQAAFKSLGMWAAALDVGVAEHIGDGDSKRVAWEASKGE